MANEQNLKPFNTRTESEQRAIAAKGGRASGKARREKKALQDITKEILNMPIKSNKITDIEDVKSYAALKGKNVSIQEAITIAIVQKALKGDYKAAEYLRDTAGERPKNNYEISGELPVVIGGEDELED